MKKNHNHKENLSSLWRFEPLPVSSVEGNKLWRPDVEQMYQELPITKDFQIYKNMMWLRTETNAL